MDFVINGVVDFSNIDNINIIKNLDVYNLINIYENIYVNNTENNIKNNYNTSFEIASIDLYLNNLNIKKINNNLNYIYCVSFTYHININLVIDAQFKQFKIVDICSKSFVYKDLDEKLIDVLPINLDVQKLDKQLGFCINFIIVESLITNPNNIEFTHIINNATTPIDNSYALNSKKFAYIDINEEFI